MKDCALFVYGIFNKSIGVLEHAVRGKSCLPSESAAMNVLGFSLIILRDICTHDSVRGNTEDANNVVNVLLSYGLIELLLSYGASCSSKESKPCTYKGFRRDIVALIGNWVYGRKRAQDEIKSRNEILLLSLQIS